MLYVAIERHERCQGDPNRQRQTGLYAEGLYTRQAWTLSASGRYDYLREIALNYAFLLTELGIPA